MFNKYFYIKLFIDEMFSQIGDIDNLFHIYYRYGFLFYYYFNVNFK